MSKSASIVLICVITVLILFFGVFAFYPNAIEYGEYGEYRSPVYLIQKSKLLTDAEKATYQVKLDEGTEFSTVKSILNSRFAKGYGYYNIGIDYNSDSSVATIVIPKTNNPDGTSATSILNNVVQRGKVEVLKSDASSYAESNVLLTTEHFKRARTQSYASGEYTVNVCEVKLTNEGKAIADKSLSSSTSTRLVIDGEVSSNYSVFYNSGALQIQSLASVDVIASFINTGVLNAALTLDDTEDTTTVGGLVYAIILAVLILASLVFFAVRYKTLGIVAIMSHLFAAVVFVIAAGIIHMEMFNIFAAIGVVLAYAFMTAFTVLAFEKIRKLADTKAFGSAQHDGFKYCNKINLIAHAVLLVLGIILWVIPTCVTAPLGNVFVYGAVLSFAVTFGLNRLFGLLVKPLVDDVDTKTIRK